MNQAEAGEYGDPLSSLCHELAKESDTPPAKAIADLMQEIVAWVQKQLEIFVKASDQSHDLATHFIVQIQGIHLLGLTFKDLNLTQKQCVIVDGWLNYISSKNFFAINDSQTKTAKHRNPQTDACIL